MIFVTMMIYGNEHNMRTMVVMLLFIEDNIIILLTCIVISVYIISCITVRSWS